jgi:hypothetical protein
MSLDQLAASGISPETAHKAGVFIVTSAEARDLGFRGGGYDDAPLAGLAFPYRDPRTGRLLVTRLRPDVPFHGRKYIAPTGSRNHLYLPCALAEQLSDVRFDVIVVEGEKKALAVLQIAGSKYLVVGISGVWNWRTSDKETQPAADHPGTTTERVNSRPIEDLDWIQWSGRCVHIIFDSDGATNADVQRAETALCQELRKRKAMPWVVSLLVGNEGRKQGIDDVLVRHEPEQRLKVLQQLLRSAAPKRKLRTAQDTPLNLAYEPSGGFVRNFCEYVDPITDAPAVYHPFAALAVLSAIVGRNVTARFGPQRIVPNQYTCLLGPSSLFRKSTEIGIAEGLIHMIRPEVVLPNEFTSERLLDLLSRQPHGFFGWRELTGYLARAGRDYMSGAKELLMELYDCPDQYRRELKSASVVVEAPAITIFAASATTWLGEQLKGPDLRSGFLNRFAFALADKKAKFYAIPPPPDQSRHQDLLLQLRTISEIRGEMDLSGIHSGYERWLRRLEQEIYRADHPEIVSAFYTRLSILALKYAMLLELSISGRLQLSTAALEEALELIDYLKAVVTHLLRTEFAQTDSAKKCQRILRVITERPGSKRGSLLKTTGYDAQELTRALTTLQEQGDVYEQDKTWWPVL